ncbi:DnaB Replicative DNA helicase [uncultured Caudovirales phage]|uniref:DnaB Replicative DNA helicase n=1 Tax=uncultured Caudovirales phage TaxID=2100421 RepID=A0A6J7WZC5_9CAUD|nr:DnaB Replicative DNA helicase [uncultured Caudovirales phage]
MISPELGLVSAVIRTTDLVSATSAGVTKQMFMDYGEVWKWLTDYCHTHGRTPDKAEFVHDWPDLQMIKTDNVLYWVETVKSRFAQAMMLDTIAKAQDQMTDDEPPSQILKEMSSALTGLLGKVERHAVANLTEDWADAVNEVRERAQSRLEGKSVGWPYGFPTLDIATSGAQPGHLCVIGARLGHGKTFTLLRMAEEALRAGATVLFFSLEQSRNQIMYRIHSLLSNRLYETPFSSSDLMSGNVDIDSYEEFCRSLSTQLDGDFIIHDTKRGRVSAQTVASAIEAHKPDIVFIDYLTLMEMDGNDWQSIAKLTGQLKVTAEQFGVPIVVAAQLNRDAMSNSGPAGAEHLGRSDAIGQDADLIVTLVKKSKHVVHMKLAKYRHAADQQKWYVEFRPETGSMVEISADRATDVLEADADEEE